MLSCICWACLISPASCSFIVAPRSLGRLDRRLDDGRVEILNEVAHERVPADRGGRPVAGAVAGGFAYRHGQAYELAEALLQCPAKLVLEIFFRQVLRGGR